MKDKEPDLPIYDEEFPTDDEYSLQQVAGGAKNINIFYAHQYVEKEEASNPQAGTACTYHFRHPQVVDGSVAGTVYHNGNRVQTFLPLMPKGFGFTSFPYDGPKVIEAKMENKKGILTLTWDRKIKAGSSKVVVSYEYDAET